MANLYDILANAQHGDVMAELGNQFGLTPQQTQAAVAALLPAISLGLKRATATPEGLADLLATMGTQGELFAMYDDPRAAFSRQGRVAGNAVLAQLFGTPEASRAIADQAQHFSGGVTSSILKKLLPVLVGMIISGLMRSGSGKASPAPAPEPVPQQDGGTILGDILREIFGQGSAGGAGPSGPSGPVNSPVPPIGDILGSPRDGSEPTAPPPVQTPRTPQPVPFPTKTAPTDTGGGQPVPGGDLLGHILRELEKGIKEGRIKPVIVGPYEIDIPGGGGQTRQAPSGESQQPAPGSDIFGQILRDLLKGPLGGGQKSAGQAVFGELIEPGRDVDPSQIKTFRDVLDQFLGAPRR
ncbi:MAG: DUF937 domain-containing protein [Methyloceanibacter sp.]